MPVIEEDIMKRSKLALQARENVFLFIHSSYTATLRGSYGNYTLQRVPIRQLQTLWMYCSTNNRYERFRDYLFDIYKIMQ